MATTYKAQAIAHELAAQLAARFGSDLYVVESFDTDQNPLITVKQSSTPVSGEANAVIKVMPQPWSLAQDVLGNSAIQYSPHLIQLVTEANYAATTDNVADNLTRARLLKVLGPVLAVGARVEWYERAYGAAPSISDATSGNLKTTYDADLYRPLLNQI